MAKFVVELPEDILKDFKKIHDKSDDIFGQMVQAGAKVVENNIKMYAPEGIKNSPIIKKLKVSRTYKTPRDGAINAKTAFYYGNDKKSGYFKNGKKQEVAIPLVLNAFEFGTSERYTKRGLRRGRIKKQPFIRKSFNKSQIERAMFSAQKEASGGMLDE